MRGYSLLFGERAPADRQAPVVVHDGRQVGRLVPQHRRHLVPDPDIPTSETGTRHRTAERVAKQIDAPVISISEELSLVAVHRKGQKRTLEPVGPDRDRHRA